MKMSDIKDLTVQELEDKLSEERSTQSKLRFNHAVSPLENPMQLKGARRNIARLLTELGSRQMNSDKA